MSSTDLWFAEKTLALEKGLFAFGAALGIVQTPKGAPRGAREREEAQRSARQGRAPLPSTVAREAQSTSLRGTLVKETAEPPRDVHAETAKRPAGEMTSDQYESPAGLFVEPLGPQSPLSKSPTQETAKTFADVLEETATTIEADQVLPCPAIGGFETTAAVGDGDRGPLGLHVVGGGEMQLCAAYCTPHLSVRGVLAISAGAVDFEPAQRELRPYRVHVELADLVECGTVSIPSEAVCGHGVAHFLLLTVWTEVPQDSEISPFCLVVIGSERLDEVKAASALLLESLERGQGALTARASTPTVVPFPCSDPLSCELPAVLPDAATGSQSGGEWSSASAELDSGGDDFSILTVTLADQLTGLLPSTLRSIAPRYSLRFTPKAHGTSLHTLYRSVAEDERTFLLVRDASGRVFGGFAPVAWEPQSRFFGSGEAFVFTVDGPESDEGRLRYFPWTARNELYMFASNELLGMGGDDGHYALAVQEGLLRGTSAASATFGNPALAASGDFAIADLEIWALEDVCAPRLAAALPRGA